MAVNNKSQEISIQPLRQGTIKLRMIGTTPLFFNRMSSKAKNQLLVGGGKKTSAEKKAIKHNPLEEFRASVDVMRSGPTALGVPVIAIKSAMATAAIETAGLTKTSAQRLIFMPHEFSPVWGVPQLRMDVVRSADINKTPDVRTRAFLPKWAAEVEIKFVMPQFDPGSIISLLCNAGMLIGIGDFRQEKGKGSYGSFRVVSDGVQDAEWDEIVATGGRDAQLNALETPTLADENTVELMDHFFAEVDRRGINLPAYGGEFLEAAE